MSVSSVSANSLSSLVQTMQSSMQNSSVKGEDKRMPPPPPQEGGQMMSDLSDVLEELGISTATSTSSTDESSDSTTVTSSDDQLKAFMETLMKTLHEQGAGKGESGSGSEYGETNPMKTDMQSLISKLTSSGSSSDSAISELQSQFSALLGSSGAANSGVTLSDFLQKFSSKIPDGSNSRLGSVVNTSA